MCDAGVVEGDEENVVSSWVIRSNLVSRSEVPKRRKSYEIFILRF